MTEKEFNKINKDILPEIVEYFHGKPKYDIDRLHAYALDPTYYKGEGKTTEACFKLAGYAEVLKNETVPCIVTYMKDFSSILFELDRVIKYNESKIFRSGNYELNCDNNVKFVFMTDNNPRGYNRDIIPIDFTR